MAGFRAAAEFPLISVSGEFLMVNYAGRQASMFNIKKNQVSSAAEGHNPFLNINKE